MPDDFMNRTAVSITRIFRAPVEAVWRAWTEPDLYRQWIWASMGREVWAEIDLRVGGAYRVYTKAPGGRHQGDGWSGACGIYITIEPHRRLVYTLHWDADVGYNAAGKLALDEVVDVTMVRDGDGTRVTFFQRGIPDDGVSVKGHTAGTQEAFDFLDRLLAGASA